MGPAIQHQARFGGLSPRRHHPFAVISPALYLAASRTDDAELLRYLALANEQVTAIVTGIKAIRPETEEADIPRPSTLPGTMGKFRQAA